jgi:hypothetical protein
MTIIDYFVTLLMERTTSLALGELPATYDKAINSVQTSFYDPALAAKAKLRVEV